MKKRGLLINIGLFMVLFWSGLLTVEAQSNELTFNCLGIPQYFSVPPGVTQITAYVNGSSGGAAESRRLEDVSGGRGAIIITTVNVVPGQLLTINAGCRTGFGFPRGGLTPPQGDRPGLEAGGRGGSGGGASSIMLGNELLVVAGGGGAAGRSGGFFQNVGLGGLGGDGLLVTGNGRRGAGINGGQGGIFGASLTPQGQDGGAVQGILDGRGGGGGGGYPKGGGGGGGSPSPSGGGGGGGGGESYINQLYAVQIAPIGLGLPGDDGSVTILWTGPAGNNVTYRCTETRPTYTVPAGVRQLRVTGAGADGGGTLLYQNLQGNFRGAGLGIGRTAIINVQPGEILYPVVGCKGKVGTLGGPLDPINPGGAGGFGYIPGGKGGDGDHPILTLDSGKFGTGGGGATGIGRANGAPLFVAAGGGGGGAGGFLGCTDGAGGSADLNNGSNATGCLNSGKGGLLGDGNRAGGSGCSYCSSGGGGGGGGGYPAGGGGDAGGIGFGGGGGGGGGKSYVIGGSEDFRVIDTFEYRRLEQLAILLDPEPGTSLILDNNPIDGFLQITPIYTSLARPIVTPVITPQEPDGSNNWYRSNISLTWDISSETPFTTQGCQPANIASDNAGIGFSCQAANAAGSTSASTLVIKRDATLPNISAVALKSDGTPYTFGTVSNQPVTVTFNCSDATSGVDVCPPAQTFNSNATVSAVVTDKAGNARTVTFGDVVFDGNLPPTISEIAALDLPVNTSSDFIQFNIGDDSTPAGNLTVTAISSNQAIIPNQFVSLTTEPNPANRTIRVSPVANKIGVTIITVTVRDAQGLTASRDFAVRVNCGTITIQQTSGQPRTFGTPYDNQLSAIGGVGPYRFRLLNGNLPSGLAFSPDWTRIFGDVAGQLGTFPLDYEVSDANGCTVQSRINVEIVCFTNYTVQSVIDYDYRSLRFAVAGACPNSFIDFAPAVQNSIIDISREIAVNKSLTIQGPGANKINLRNIEPYGSNSRIFNVTAPATISGLTISGGNTANAPGGGIVMSFGDLTVRESVITGNRADYGGGGIANTDPNATLTLINSTVSNNIGADNLNQGNNAGGIRSLGPVNIVNSTVSGNLGGGQANIAGGIYAPSGLISNSTITDNGVDTSFSTPANSASGVFGGANPNRLTIRSSIIAGNRNNTTLPDVVNLFTSSGFNLIGNRGAVTAFNQQGDQTGTSASPLNPLLDILRLNGGTTPTHAFSSLLSPALDKGHSFTLTLDQRGAARTYDNPSLPNAAGGDGADIGAYELQAPTAANVSVSGRIMVGNQGLRSAIVCLTDPSGQTRQATTGTFGYYRFDNVTAGETYVITVVSKRYQFTPRILTVNDELTDLNFFAEPF